MAQWETVSVYPQDTVPAVNFKRIVFLVKSRIYLKLVSYDKNVCQVYWW